MITFILALIIKPGRSLMAQWLRQVSEEHEMYCPQSEGHRLEPQSGQTLGTWYF